MSKYHPSHDFDDAAREADPMAEGCGRCACLPNDPESFAPCDPPKPLLSAPISCERARLLDLLAKRPETVPEAPRDVLDVARDVVASSGYGVTVGGLSMLVERLARDLAWSRINWRLLADEVALARFHRTTKGGQQAGIPLIRLAREAESALRSPPDVCSTADLLKAAIEDSGKRAKRAEFAAMVERAAPLPKPSLASLKLTNAQWGELLRLGQRPQHCSGNRWYRIQRNLRDKGLAVFRRHGSDVDQPSHEEADECRITEAGRAHLKLGRGPT